MLDTYLPKRYQAAKAFVVDSLGNFSEQIDVVVFDRQYSPFIFKFDEQIIVPAESVYAVFEAKQTATAELVAYAQRKVASVRKLHRTSLPIPHAGGTYPAKPLIPVLGGLLTFESDWSPALGPSFDKALKVDMSAGRLDLGCVASHGHFFYDGSDNTFKLEQENKPATAFLFRLIAQLQFSGTVPMIDIDAYGKWLTK
ncbi:hypothetical protein HNP29_002067 [Pseudomonas alcaligenes]|nr:hypothetical protein [Pseudomonas alcaligenes]